MDGAGAPAGTDETAPLSLSDPALKAFLASTLLALPGLTWQAWVLGASFRQRRGKPVADTNALAEGAAKLQQAAAAAKRAAANGAAGAGVDTAAKPAEPPSSPPSSSSFSSSSSPHKGRPLLFVAGVTLLFLFAKAWLARVLALVPAPYLDEVFHIPQAQTYCAGRWRDWDDKITTPPGLYVVSVALKPFWSGEGCSVWALRAANNVAIMLVAATASSCRAALEASRGSAPATTPKGHRRLLSLYAFHSAINIALFPVLFFFSALYYTDVYATLAALLAYRNHLYRLSFVGKTTMAPFWTDAAAIVLGVVALAFRQTNIFWVVIYMGGVEAVHAVKRVGLWEKREADVKPAGTLSETITMYARKYTHGTVHDPPLGDSGPDDCALAVASVGVGAVANVGVVLRQVWPHVAVMAAFAGFVAWNGGVVLGDKANHVATTHFAQLLYVWALMAFFSAPLFVTHAAGYAQQVVGCVWGAETRSTKSTKASTSKKVTAAYALAVLTAMLAAVHGSTIIHPFTLADNRHYMFYVFRYTIRRPAVRYALVPVYGVAAWACWRILWGPPQVDESAAGSKSSESSKRSSKTSSDKGPPFFLSLLDEDDDGAATAARTGPTTTTALLWLLATALSLMSAPLVEPRYFILPWVFWRLQVPAATLRNNKKVDIRLILETLWFVAINAATMYMFLYRPYVWRAADGSLLDGGRLQRFMW